MSAILNLKLIYPNILAIILIIISSVPVKISGISGFMPMVDVMLIYYWCIYRPSSMPSWFVFLMGILRDAISGVPLGVNALNNVLVRWFVVHNREGYIKEQFVVLWRGFIIFAVVSIAIKWVTFSFIFDNFIGLNMAFMQLLLSVSIYPLFHYLFNLIHSTLPGVSVDA